MVASQQKSYVGSAFPLAGFFYTGPERKTLFHQFHRGNDQAPIVALASLCEAFPEHADWMKWYSTVALYAEYQKSAARVHRAVRRAARLRLQRRRVLEVPEEGDRYQATREAFARRCCKACPWATDGT